MNGDVGICCMLDIPLVGEGVATDNNLQACIFEYITDRSITCMNSRDRAYSDAILLVNYRVNGLVIKFLDGDFSRFRAQHKIPGSGVPVKGLEEMLYGVFGTHIFCLAPWSPNF